MTELEINKTIHEARGLCWHEPEIIPFPMVCSKCGEGILKHPSYTCDWADYGEVLEWAKEQKWWEDVAYVDRYYGIELNVEFDEALLNPLTGSTILAKFIKETLPLLEKDEYWQILKG